MKILAFDTSSTVLSVVLVSIGPDGTIEYEESESFDRGLRHAETLMPQIALLLERCRLGVSNLDLVVTSAGPGSFTGLRIGFATAKGLVAAGVPAFVAVAAADCYARSRQDYPGIVLPVGDARKGRWYAALYRAGRRLSSYLDLSPDDLLAAVEQQIQDSREKVLISGPDAAAFYSLLETAIEGDRTGRCPTASESFECCPESTEGIAAVMARIGYERFLAGEHTAEDAGPDYLRSSEAEIGIRRRTSQST